MVGIPVEWIFVLNPQNIEINAQQEAIINLQISWNQFLNNHYFRVKSKVPFIEHITIVKSSDQLIGLHIKNNLSSNLFLPAGMEICEIEIFQHFDSFLSVKNKQMVTNHSSDNNFHQWRGRN